MREARSQNEQVRFKAGPYRLVLDE
jgi:hypothetical protein